MYTTSMALGPQRPIPITALGPNSVMVVHVGPPGIGFGKTPNIVPSPAEISHRRRWRLGCLGSDHS